MLHDTYHIPAMAAETIELMDIRPDGTYIDATFGGGGHSRLILEALGPEGHLYGFDQDLDAMANVPDDPRFTFVRSNFRYAENFMRFYGVDKVDGILVDLGVSFHHFDASERGFSFREDAPLDMRMNRESSRTAAQVVNDFDEEQLTQLLRDYGDLKNGRLIARAIAKARACAPIETTLQLAAAVEPVINPRQAKKEMAQVFQALRIEVNGEMQALSHFLQSTTEMLRPGGRLTVLTYHSLEDRMVKNFMKAGKTSGEVEKDFFGNVSTPWRIITRSPITASATEVQENPRARSARLRCAELKEPENTRRI